MTRAPEPAARPQRSRSPGEKVSLAVLLLLGFWAAWLTWERYGSHRVSGPVGDGGALTEAELRGKAIFLRGVTSSGTPLTGRLGPEAVELTGDVVACGRCHGPRGKGSGEGGVAVPNIQASRLFTAVGPAAPATEARERPAYDDRSLAEAILRGTSADGKPLGPVMPRFELGPRDLADLLAYLHRLGEDRDPGVAEDRLLLGAALPLSGRLAPVGEDVRAVLSAALDEVNQQGGLFGRRLELRVEDEALTREGQDATERLLKAGVFALVGSVRAGPRPSDTLLETEGVPLVAPVGLSDAHAEDGGRMIFYVYPGPQLQARVAIQHLHAGWDRRRAEPVIAVLHSRDDAGEDWARGARTEATRRDWPSPKELAYPPGQLNAEEALRWLRGSRADAVLFSGTPTELNALLTALGSTMEVPLFYAPGALARPTSDELLPLWERVSFVQPLPASGPGAGLREFEAFLRRHAIAPRNRAFQQSAYASVRLLVEALRRSGADLDRASLVSALESFQDVDTGVTWPITFGAQGRVGIRGGFIVRLDARARTLAPLSDWIALSP